MTKNLIINPANVAQYNVLTNAYLKLRELKTQRAFLDEQIKEQELIVGSLFVQEGIKTAAFVDQGIKVTYTAPTTKSKPDFDSTYQEYKHLLPDEEWFILKKVYNEDNIIAKLGDKVINKVTNVKLVLRETKIE